MRSPLTDVDIALTKIVAGDRAADHESPTLDFKEDKIGSLGDTEKLIADAAICFANSAGGSIVLGVSDKARGAEALVGTKLEPERVAQRVYELTRPHLNVSVSRHTKFNNVLIIKVPQSAEIHSDTQGRAYQRINRDCHPMTPDQQARLREERHGIDWSAQASGKTVGDVDQEAILVAKNILSKFHDSRRQLALLSNQDLMAALGALAPNGELNRAGDLMFCEASTQGSAGIVYQYRTTPGGEPKLVQRSEAPLLVAVTKTIEFIAALQSQTPMTLPNGQQISIENFPSLAVREAISNALCHRDYHMNGAVVIEHSPEVFLVTSPGPLVSGVTTANIITTTSRPRNPALSNMVRVLGLAEELGRGIDRMYREMIRSGRDVPRIDAEFDHVKVTLVGGAPNTNITRFIATLPDEEREDTDTMLILYKLCSTKTVTAAGSAAWLQKTPQEAEAVLRRLATDGVGLLECTRATVGRSMPTYRLKEAPLKMLGPAVLYQRRTTDEIDRKVIAHVREYGKITNRTLQNLFDVHVFKARDIITDLVQRDILVRISEQQRGSKVEWGPGTKFPFARMKKRTKETTTEDKNQLRLVLDKSEDES